MAITRELDTAILTHLHPTFTPVVFPIFLYYCCKLMISLFFLSFSYIIIRYYKPASGVNEHFI